MISKRIGHWSWTLTADERETAAAIARRLREQTTITTKLQHKHVAMLEKQRKLDQLEEHLLQQGATLINRSRQRFRRPHGALSAPGAVPG